MPQTKKYKIAIIGDCLALGGAEKVHSVLSVYLDSQGFDIHNCIFVDNVTYPFRGTLLSLGTIKPNATSIVRKMYRFIAFYKFIKTNNFDCIIDFRMRQNFIFEFINAKIIYPENIIYTVHSGVLKYYFPENKYLSKILYKNKKISTVSKAIENEIRLKKNLQNLITIYNPINFEVIKNLKNEFSVDRKYILAVGNMTSTVKQIDKLIVAYSTSSLPLQGISLILLGEGTQKNQYINLVNDLELSHLIEFKGVVNNPFPYYTNALFLVLSSKNEGFPNVIIESLACGTPAVAFDCFSGPSEIITNFENGILVENQNFEQLTSSINMMLSDKVLYQKCKTNARESVSKFSVEVIGKQLIDYMYQE